MDLLEQDAFEGLSGFYDSSASLTTTERPERVATVYVSTGMFSMLRAEPAIGRAFVRKEAEPGRNRVAVLSHGLWRRRFGSDPGVVGKTVSLNGTPRTVVGVMPPGFAFPEKDTQLWVPLAPSERRIQARQAFWLQTVGRLREGASVEQARADLGGICASIQSEFPDMAGYGVNVVGLHDQVVGGVRPALLVAVRFLTADRWAALASGLGMMTTTLVFSGKGPGGSVIVPEGALGTVWTLALPILVAVVVALPDRIRPLPEN